MVSRSIYIPYTSYIKLGRIDWSTVFFPWSILDRITDGNNLLCFYYCMFNLTVSLQINRFLAYFFSSYYLYFVEIFKILESFCTNAESFQNGTDALNSYYASPTGRPVHFETNSISPGRCSLAGCNYCTKTNHSQVYTTACSQEPVLFIQLRELI